MGYPQLQQSVTAHGSTSFSTVTFGSGSTKGDGILVGVTATATTGTVLSIGVTDNHGNTYNVVQVNNGKSAISVVLAASNLIVGPGGSPPNGVISLTLSATFSGGSLLAWSVVGAEYSNVNAVNIVKASANGSSLTLQPARTTAVAFRFAGYLTNNGGITGPPWWNWEAADPNGVTSVTLYDSANFPGGTVSFNPSPGGGNYMLLVLNPSNALPVFVESNQGKIQLSATDLVNGATGSGPIVLANAPVLTAAQFSLIGIGGVPNTSAAITILGTPTLGATQTGINVAPTLSSVATAYTANDTNVAITGTVSLFQYVAFRANDIIFAPGLTVASSYGVLVNSPFTGYTANYALYISGNGTSGYQGASTVVTLTSVANHSGNFATYTGTGVPVGISTGTVVISGFTNPLNNGTFILGGAMSGGTTFTVGNANAVAETHPATATFAANWGIFVNVQTPHQLGPSGSVAYIGTSTIGNAVTVGSHLSAVSNTDFAGIAAIPSGTSVTINFTSNFTGTNAPIVVLTPTSNAATGIYWVTYTGSSGAWTAFTVNITSAVVVTFNYIVIGNQS